MIVRRTSKPAMLIVSVVVALSLAAAACSLTVDTDDLNTGGGGALEDSPSTTADDGPPMINGPKDDAGTEGGASALCRPGFRGADCQTACPDKTAGRECDYRRVLALDLPSRADWDVPADVPYGENATASAGPFTRIGYHFILDGQELWVEFDKFTDDATKIGVPVDWIFQKDVTNVIFFAFDAPNLRSNQLTPSSGNVEMFHHCYGPGGDNAYDSTDTITMDEPHCYGSMQVHAQKKVVFAINRFSNPEMGRLDLGIGPRPTKDTDWTFAGNAHDKRRLEVYVR